MWGEEVLIVSVDTRHFARGPVFRAADLLKVSGCVRVVQLEADYPRIPRAMRMIGSTGASI